MKKSLLLILMFIMIFITACNSSPPTNTESPNSPENSEQNPPPGPNNTESSNSFEPYPGALAIPPTATPYPPGYPAPQTIPTPDPYPGGKTETTVWIVFPVGIQCEDADDGIKYKSEKEAEAGLTAAGIQVRQVTTTELMVCAACGCPTSAHYRAEINEADLNKANALEWVQE